MKLKGDGGGREKRERGKGKVRGVVAGSQLAEDTQHSKKQGKIIIQITIDA